jgi:hypothetical protein
MSFRAQLASDSYSVEPGVAASVAIEIENESNSPIKVELQVEGIDPEWSAIPVPLVEVPGREKTVERVYLKPPREPESVAGSYPFVLRLRTEQGDEKAIPCSLEIKPFHNVSIDVQPRRGSVTTMSPETVFHVTVMNLGNVEHTVKLFASDPAELFVFEFDTEQVSVAPGAQKTVSMRATASKVPLLANARLQQLSVAARSLDDKTVATATHAQIEQRSLVTPGLLWLGGLFVFFVAAAILLMPRSPVVDAFSITPDRVWAGEPFTVEWSASNARSVELWVGDQVFRDLRPSGTKTVASESLLGEDEVSRQVEVRIRALSGRRESDFKSRLVAVRFKEPPPEPQILEFAITPTDLEVGQAFQVTYKLSDSVTEAELAPIGLILDPQSEGVQLNAQVAGDFDYKLIARNQAGAEVEKVIRISVKVGSKASIVVFRADPALVDPFDGRVTLTWHVLNAERIELIENDGRPQVLDSAQGELTKLVSFDTTFKLRVVDSDGVEAVKEVTVRTYTPDDYP